MKKKKKKTVATAAELDRMAGEVQATLDAVLADAQRRDWSSASRSVLELVHAARRIENEVDFQYMNEWLDRAKAATDG